MNLARHAWRSGAAAMAFVLTLLPGPTSAQADGGQQPTFRSSVDLVVLDVQVVDATGRPAVGLPASSFDVRIDGRRRKVVSADLLHYAPGGGNTTAAGVSPGGPAARNIWPASTTAPGRTFVLAVDAVSLSSGEGAGVVRAARAFVDRLPTNDAVGIVMFPRGATLRPTTDRDAVRGAIGKVVGLQSMRANPFHLTPAEAIDIATEMDQVSLSAMSAPRGGRGTGAVTVTADVLRQVQARECQGTVDAACTAGIVIDADAQSRQIEDQVSESLTGLKALLTLLTDYPGRKTVVLLSAGMPVSDRSGGWHRDGSEARALGRAAALANATVYSIHLDSGYRSVFSAETRTTRATSLARDRDMQQRLLADFAFASGGALFEAPTDAGENGLARVLLESSAFYSLGVAPEARDLDGRPHALGVSVAERGLTLRSRRFVVLRPSR